MQIFTNSLPQWVSLLFIACFLVPLFMLFKITKEGINHSSFNKESTIKSLPFSVFLFFIAYYLYVAILSYSGVFYVNTLPPKILIFTSIPLTLFYFLIVFRTKTFWTILENVKLSSLVRIHIFRLVGVFFIIGWYYDILPKSFAFIGGIGDIFAALTAIYVSRIIDNKSTNYKKITLVWNIIGFWDIICVICSAIYITNEAIKNNSEGILEMTKFPFSLIPAFAPATIIFLHICIFKKLKMSV